PPPHPGPLPRWGRGRRAEDEVEHAAGFAQGLAANEGVGFELAGAAQVGAGNTGVMFEEFEKTGGARSLDRAGIAGKVIAEVFDVSLRGRIGWMQLSRLIRLIGPIGPRRRFRVPGSGFRVIGRLRLL